MTDGYIAGLNPKSGLKPNANLEAGEYIKTPDGSVAQVLGKRHSKGGVDLLLPEMTAVLSDTEDLTLTKKQVKEIKKQYDVDVTTKNTYADVLDRYARKIGLSKLLSEQEDAFIQLKKATENALSEGSLRVNNQFLQKKIYDLQVGITEKQTAMGAMFEKLFQKQEEQKGTNGEAIPTSPPEQSGEINPTIQASAEGDLTEQQIMEFGGCVGCVDKLKSLASKHGISQQSAYMILKKGGRIPQYQDGGYTVFTSKNPYGEEYRDKRRKQSKGSSAFGEVEAQQAIEYLYTNFPTVLSSDKYKGLIEIKDGKPKLKEGLNLRKENEVIYNLQNDMDKQMKSSAQYIVDDNTGRFSQEAKKTAQTYLERETFTQDKNIDKGIRTYDKKLGEFTGGRYSLGIDLVTPEDFQKLATKGITTIQQLTDEDIAMLSPESQRRVNEIKPTLTKGEDFLISKIATETVKPNTPAPKINEKEEQIATDPGTGQPIVDDINYTPAKSNFPRLFYTPDQSLPPPIGLQAESLEQIELQRLDPLRIGIEDQLKKIGDERGFVASQLESLPPSQRASTLASVIATASATESDAITKSNQFNTQNVSKVEQYNASIADKENVANAEARMQYEARALAGLGKTQNEIHNYFMANREIYLNNVKEQQKMNTLSNLFPDVSVDFYGIGSYYDPSETFQLSGGSSGNYSTANYLNSLYKEQLEKEKKKKEKEEKESE